MAYIADKCRPNAGRGLYNGAAALLRGSVANTHRPVWHGSRPAGDMAMGDSHGFERRIGGSETLDRAILKPWSRVQ